jgi:formylmethanofuran dehydrogenase subunit B
MIEITNELKQQVHDHLIHLENLREKRKELRRLEKEIAVVNKAAERSLAELVRLAFIGSDVGVNQCMVKRVGYTAILDINKGNTLSHTRFKIVYFENEEWQKMVSLPTDFMVKLEVR